MSNEAFNRWRTQVEKVHRLARSNQGLGDDADFKTLIQEARRADELAEFADQLPTMVPLIEKLEKMQNKVEYYRRTGWYAET